MTTTVLISAALVLLLLLLLLAPLASRRARAMDSYIEHMEGFFRAANALMDDKDTPEPILDILYEMSRRINLSEPARSYIWFALTNGFNVEPSKSSREMLKLVKKMRCEMKEQFGIAVARFIFATSCKSLFLGWVLRRAILVNVENISHYPRYAEKAVFETSVPPRHNFQNNQAAA